MKEEVLIDRVLHEFQENNIEVQSCKFTSANIRLSSDLTLETDCISVNIKSNYRMLWWPLTGRVDQSPFDGLTNDCPLNYHHVESSLLLKEATFHIKRMLE